MTTVALQPFPEPDRCPQCKLGIVLESNFGWWCSRRYYKDAPCDWEKGDPGPPPVTPAPTTAHATHIRKHRRGRVRPYGALDPRTCNQCGGTICCMYGQRPVSDPRAPGGVWLLHPWCQPPVAPAKRRARA